MENYQPVSAYQDIMDELKRVTNVFFYGPGFPSYAASDTIDTIIRKFIHKNPGFNKYDR